MTDGRGNKGGGGEMIEKDFIEKVISQIQKTVCQ